jgi:hypothetical protein
MAKIISQTKEIFNENLNYELYVKAYKDNILASKIAEHFNKSVEYVIKLASDPDHGNQTTVSSFIEAMVALELEQDGIMGLSVGRGKKETDLIDGWGRMWDVKAPPTLKKINFNIEVKEAIHSVIKKLQEFPKGNLGILLCVSFLNKQDFLIFESKLKPELSENQRFLIRLVHIEGVL